METRVEHGSNTDNFLNPFFWRRFCIFARVNYNQTQHIKVTIYRTSGGRFRADNVMIELNGYSRGWKARIWTVQIELNKLWDLKDKLDKLGVIDTTTDDIMLEIFKELTTPII